MGGNRRKARTAHRADTGSSANTAIAMAIMRSGPAAEVMTSNQASTVSSMAVAAAVSRYRASRLSSSTPVTARPSASMLSSPVHAAAQLAACALSGSTTARPASHGTMPRPATSMARPSQRPGRGLIRVIRTVRPVRAAWVARAAWVVWAARAGRAARPPAGRSPIRWSMVPACRPRVSRSVAHVSESQVVLAAHPARVPTPASVGGHGEGPGEQAGQRPGPRSGGQVSGRSTSVWSRRGPTPMPQTGAPAMSSSVLT